MDLDVTGHERWMDTVDTRLDDLTKLTRKLYGVAKEIRTELSHKVDDSDLTGKIQEEVLRVAQVAKPPAEKNTRTIRINFKDIPPAAKFIALLGLPSGGLLGYLSSHLQWIP